MFAPTIATLKPVGVFSLDSEEAELTLAVLQSQVSPILIPLKNLFVKLADLTGVKCL